MIVAQFMDPVTNRKAKSIRRSETYRGARRNAARKIYRMAKDHAQAERRHRR